jgi:uncharacterized protein YjbJ (UPF0337 family)
MQGEWRMTDDRMAGTGRNIGGKVQEDVGKLTGIAKTEAKGMMEQAVGTVQDAYGQAVDAAAEGADAVKQMANEGHDFLKGFIEENPHTATAIAIGIGFFLGYAAHQPPRRRSWWD